MLHSLLETLPPIDLHMLQLQQAMLVGGTGSSQEIPARATTILSLFTFRNGQLTLTGVTLKFRLLSIRFTSNRLAGIGR